MLAVVFASSANLIPVLFSVIYWGFVLWAVVSVCRNLRGGLRIFWVAIIIGSFLFIPLIGIILSVMYFAFKKRFVAIQH
jgi:hypothetical protein